ncbi:type IV pilus modification protein PilV [Thiorhodococcus fuscus]|uniref:Type IV pilus modification protein PilV n=1 Tax=Thiorhodococcus fuscus TaxID=527200 RepID=A0ABW4Y769_9GAMM
MKPVPTRLCHVSKHRAPGLRNRAGGMTLLEVLIAAVVIGFGLLGVAALQLSTMKVTTDSLARSQAVMLAEFIADRIRTNAGGTSTYDGLSCDATACKSGGTTTATTETCETSACSSADIALFDAAQWRQELASSASYLSSVTGTLAQDSNDVWTIRIFWDDSGIYGDDALNRDSASTLDCIPQSATNKASLQCYQIRVVL